MHSSPKAPSVVSRTCELSPAGRSSVNREEQALYRAPFRLLSTRALRQAVLRASSRLAPSRFTSPCGLPMRKTRDASNRLLPPERRRLPVRRTFSTHSDGFHRLGRPATVRGCHVALSRQRAFSRCPKRFGLILRQPSERVVLVPSSSRLWVTSAGLFDAAALAGMRPLTPLSRTLSSSSRSRHLRACSRFPRTRPYGFERRRRVGRVKDPPRPPSTPAREDRCLQTIRGAFHRQGPFVGSGGHYSPGPATDTPPFGRWEGRR
jgi:hypothetical protein